MHITCLFIYLFTTSSLFSLNETETIVKNRAKSESENIA